MLSTLFDTSSVPLLEQVVNFTEARHGVLAGNIANLDTPGYTTRDLSPELFQSRLKEALETRPAPPVQSFGYGSYGNYDSSPLVATDSADRADRNLDAFAKVKDSY